MRSPGRRSFLAVVAAAFLLLVAPAGARAEGVTVFAAASLKNALDDAAAAFVREGGPKPAISYAASSVLAKQIENGAPADLFISADLDWMNYVAERHLIRPETRFDFLGNRLVLVTAAGAQTVEIAPGFPLRQLLGEGRLAMGDPSGVPAGKYGKAALEKLGVWASVADRVAQAENVRAALAFVSRGEAPFGIVYATDAAADPGVAVAGTFPPESYPPIIYPAALTAASHGDAAAGFLAFLRRPSSAPFFEKQGFTVLKTAVP